MSDEVIQPSGKAGNWTLRGIRSVVSIPGLALFVSAVGFGGLAQSVGWPLLPSMFATFIVYALPSQFVFIGSLAAGASLLGAAFAVTLSAVRLLPMTVSLLPLLRSGGARTWQLLLAAQFIAMTVWLESFRHMPGMPAEGRLRFYSGLTSMLVLFSVLGTGAGYVLATELPAPLATGLVAVTPLYFLYSLEKGARGNIDRLAIVLGFALGIIAVYATPGFELLVAGVVGGTIAYILERRKAAQESLS